MAARPSPSDEKLQDEAERLRSAVVITGIGIPSEVWALRQGWGFARFDPALAGWSVDPDDETPKDNETRIAEGRNGPLFPRAMSPNRPG